MSSIAYAEQVQALNNNPTWADHVEISEPQGPALSYATPKVGQNDNANEAIATESMPEPRNTDANNNSTCQPQGLEASVIPYSINQPADPQLWDGSFCPISIFGVNEYLEGDSKNIACSLYRIAAFIKQRSKTDHRVWIRGVGLYFIHL